MLTILPGAILGFLVSITSVGTGAIGLTALLMLYPAYPAIRLVGTNIAHAVPLTLVADRGHWFMGSVDSFILIRLLIGSIPGIIVGSQLSSWAPERALRILLAIVLTIVAIRLILT